MLFSVLATTGLNILRRYFVDPGILLVLQYYMVIVFTFLAIAGIPTISSKFLLFPSFLLALLIFISGLVYGSIIVGWSPLPDSRCDVHA